MKKSVLKVDCQSKDLPSGGEHWRATEEIGVSKSEHDVARLWQSRFH